MEKIEDLYQITCSVTSYVDGWARNVPIPTFWVRASSARNAIDITFHVVAHGKWSDHREWRLHVSTCRESDRDDYYACTLFSDGREDK
jgi:hypothetical protein